VRRAERRQDQPWCHRVDRDVRRERDRHHARHRGEDVLAKDVSDVMPVHVVENGAHAFTRTLSTRPSSVSGLAHSVEALEDSALLVTLGWRERPA